MARVTSKLELTLKLEFKVGEIDLGFHRPLNPVGQGLRGFDKGQSKCQKFDEFMCDGTRPMKSLR